MLRRQETGERLIGRWQENDEDCYFFCYNTNTFFHPTNTYAVNLFANRKLVYIQKLKTWEWTEPWPGCEYSVGYKQKLVY